MFLSTVHKYLFRVRICFCYLTHAGSGC